MSNITMQRNRATLLKQWGKYTGSSLSPVRIFFWKTRNGLVINQFQAENLNTNLASTSHISSRIFAVFCIKIETTYQV